MSYTISLELEFGTFVVFDVFFFPIFNLGSSRSIPLEN